MSRKFPSLRSLWIASFLGRLTFLLFNLSVLTLYFYIVGSFQGLTERTLLLLVNTELWILATCTTSAFLSTLGYIVVNVLGHWQKKLQFASSLIVLFLSITMYFTVAILQAFFSPHVPLV